MLRERVDKELQLLRTRFPGLQTTEQKGVWLLISDYVLPEGIWVQDKHNLCFQVPTGYPGTAPYAFYISPQPKLCGEQQINNITPAVTEPPFPGEWVKFSWSMPEWRAADIQSGYNLLNFALSFQKRLKEGA